MQRDCFVLRLKPGRVSDYLAAHGGIRADVLDAIRGKGWSNFSLFVLAEEGLVIGYRERAEGRAPGSGAESPPSEVGELWQESMAEYFVNGRPDWHMRRPEEYFHLE